MRFERDPRPTGTAHSSSWQKSKGPIAGSSPDTGEERAVGLNGQAFGRFRHQVTVAEDAFHPLEKQFDLPAVAVNQRDQLRFDLQIGDQQQLLAIHFNFDHTDQFALPGDTRHAVERVC